MDRIIQQAVIKALEYLNDGYEWIVDIDLEKFFDTVNQDRLITKIRRTIKDGDVVSLIRKYLSAGVMENGVIEPTKVEHHKEESGNYQIYKTTYIQFAINNERLRKR